MNQEFFTNLPSDIIVNILSRLPVRTIISCKCVCKSWLHLVETYEFVKSHLCKSIPGLAIYQANGQSSLYKVFEFEDGLGLEHHELHYNPVTKFNLPYHGDMHGSANGLLVLCDGDLDPNHLCICNPITRDYIDLHCPQEFVFSNIQIDTYGFGVSRVTGQYKVVRISQNDMCDKETLEFVRTPKSESHVYTLGTVGSWRRIAPGAPLSYGCLTIGAFLNGNLHWLMFDLSGRLGISCFDLETELFHTLSPPPLPLPLPGRGAIVAHIYALDVCLCLCDNTSTYEIVIWLMKEYGVEKSWTKEFIINKSPDFFAGPFVDVVRPIKVFKDGDILIAWGICFLFYYSKKSKTTQRIDMFEQGTFIDAILHTPSFLSLKSFGMENVSFF